MWSGGQAALLGLFLCLTLAYGWRERMRRRARERERDAIFRAHQAILRLVRLAASDQRSVGLSLLSYAQQNGAPPGELDGLARRLIGLAEDLIEQTEQPNAQRHLHEEEVTLLPVIEFAMAQVAAHLGSGHRSWRLSPDLRQARVLADRRAMNQVLVNVLSGAAAATRNGDLIELSTEAGGGEWSLVVQDEGIGLPVSADEAGKAGGRGIGLGLTLARSLMQAHEGALIVESAERVGTRVRLSFPASRVLA